MTALPLTSLSSPFRRRAFIAAGLLVTFGALSAQAQDWQTSLTDRPGNHPALRPLTIEYDFGWSGVKAASARAEFSRSKDSARLALAGRTSGLARTLWRMDSTGTSLVNTTTLRPVQLDQTEKYARKTVRTAVSFTSAGPHRVKTTTPAEAEPSKPKTFEFGNVHDLHSAYLFIRSQPLQPGDTVRMCVFPSSSPYLAEVTVAPVRKISVAGKQWNAIPCQLKLRRIDKEFALSPHEKFKTATVWLSNDPDRLLLKIEAAVHVGKVWAEMRSVQFADEGSRLPANG